MSDPSPLLDREGIEDAFRRLGERLARRGVVADLYVFGGAAMALEPLRAGEIPSQFGVDAPELAHPGQFAVGIRRLTLIQKDQVDVLAFDPAKGTAPRRDRVLAVDLWYPATPKPGAAPVVYQAALPAEPPAPSAEEKLLTEIRDLLAKK